MGFALCAIPATLSMAHGTMPTNAKKCATVNKDDREFLRWAVTAMMIASFIAVILLIVMLAYDWFYSW